MATMRLKFGNEKLGREYRLAMEGRARAYQAASRETAEEIRKTVLEKGREDMRRAGDFDSRRWQQGFKGAVQFIGNSNWTVTFTHDVPYFIVFEEGRVIRGKPMLWIPLSFSRAARLKVRARDFPQPLFRVDRGGGKAPLLMSPGRPAQPQYFGKTSVKIPKKFHIRQIIREQSKLIQVTFTKKMKARTK